jgi:hypothetical protein
MVIYEDVANEEAEFSPVEDLPPTNAPSPPFDPQKFQPLISLHALTGFSAPQTLKLIGYIKHKKVTILIHIGITHNFIHRHIAHEINCYICVVTIFKSWLPMVVPWNVVGVVKMCAYKLVSTT